MKYSHTSIIDIDEALNGVEETSGAFEEILHMVYADEIIPIVKKSEDDMLTIGISVDAHAEDLIADNIAGIRFSKKYAGCPTLEWVEKAFAYKEDGYDESEVLEIEEQRRREQEQIARWESKNLPESVSVPEKVICDMLNLGMSESVAFTPTMIKKYLRQTYNHYLSRNFNSEMTIEQKVVDEVPTVYINNIMWGRKISTTEI